MNTITKTGTGGLNLTANTLVDLDNTVDVQSAASALVVTGTVDADALLKATGNVDLKNGATLGGDVTAVGGDIDFRDTVVADGGAAQTFDAQGGTLHAWNTITKTTAGNLSFGGATAIDLDGMVDVQGGSLVLEDNTTVADTMELKASADIKVAAGKTLKGGGDLMLTALSGGITAADIDMSTANNKTLTLTQSDSIDMAGFTVINSTNTNLDARSTGGSVTSTTADTWQSITATADSGITLTGIGSITTNTLTSTNGDIEIKSKTAVVLNGTVKTKTGGGVTVTAQGDVTTQAITTEDEAVTTNSNIEIRSLSGDLSINDSLTANGGGVKLIADNGKVYTNDGSGMLNVAITGSSDDAVSTGVELPFGSSQKAAIVIISNEDLNLGTGAVLTANGKYYPSSTDERPNINFQLDGEEIDAAIYLASVDLSTGMGKNVDVGSAAITIDNSSGIGTLVIDAFDTVTFKNTFEDSLRLGGASDIKRLEAVSRISPDLNYARLNHTLPYADNPAMLAGGEFVLSGGVYVLRGTSAGSLFSLAKVLDITGPVPLVVPVPLEPEVQGEVEEPDMEAIARLLDELGIGVQPFLARAYRPSLNTDLSLLKAAEKLLRLGPILEDADGTRIAALVPLIRGISEAPVPVEEQMTSFVQELARQELAGQWINALVEYAAILNNDIGLPADASVARIMVRYGGKLTGPVESLFVEEYLAQSFAD